MKHFITAGIKVLVKYLLHFKVLRRRINGTKVRQFCHKISCKDAVYLHKVTDIVALTLRLQIEKNHIIFWQPWIKSFEKRVMTTEVRASGLKLLSKYPDFLKQDKMAFQYMRRDMRVSWKFLCIWLPVGTYCQNQLVMISEPELCVHPG